MQNTSPDPQVLCGFLRKADITPVLVDVGASGKLHAPWQGFARESEFVGFDPDSRDIDPALGANFKRHHIVGKIVAGPEQEGSASFYLTRFPHCSSMLPPNEAVLQSYLFADLFVVERTVTVETVTLAQALDGLGIPAADWIKVDAQGADLSVIEGLDAARLGRVLCLEMEPGFLEFYTGEQMFPEIHGALVQKGFWLAHLNCQQFPRVRRATVRDALGVEIPATHPAARLLGTSPTAGEARYFRTLEHLKAQNATARDYAVAWIFAVSMGQWGYALDLAADARAAFGDAGPARFIYQSSVATIAGLLGLGTKA